MVVFLPKSLTPTQKLALWSTVSRNRGLLSLDKVLLVQNSVPGIIVVDRLLKKLKRNLEEARILLIERPVFPHDWSDYKNNRAPSRIPRHLSPQFRGRFRDKKAIRGELTLAREP